MRTLAAGILLMFFSFLCANSAERPDSLPGCDNASSTRWISQLINNGFSINDTSICYPRFPRFCLAIYNWGDRTFNSYDRDYVVGTGKNWKLQGKSYNWLETSTMVFPKNAYISMHSDLYSDAGFSLSFMAVSVGYMWNVNSIFSKPTKRRTFNFDFTCSRFSINYQSVSSSGGMIITRFGDFNEGHHIRYNFNDCSLDAKTLDGYYFFNHRRYSQGAAYSYSKYQLQSAGTALVGFDFTEQKINMNFSSLPSGMLAQNPLGSDTYSSHYRSYSAMGGYAYNWVLKPRRWLVNITSMGAIGYKELMDRSGRPNEAGIATESDDGERHDTKESLATIMRLNVGAIYNHKAFFASFTVRGSGYLNFFNNVSHFNSIVSFTATAGMRF